MTHTLTTHLFLGYLNAAAVADDAFVADAFILAAVALPVARRAENALAEEAVALGLIGAVVDSLGLCHLAFRAANDGLWRCKADGNRIKIVLYLCCFLFESHTYSILNFELLNFQFSILN